MTATNHTVTGMAIAAAVGNPWLALPLAFASHFVLDAIPHFGNHAVINKQVRAFSIFLIADMAVAAALLLCVIFLAPANMWMIVAGGVIAASPDLMWIPEYLAMLKGQARAKGSTIKAFHSRLQREMPSAFVIEAAWFIGMSALLLWLMQPV